MAALSLSLSKLAKLVEVLQKLSKRMYAITHTHRNGNNSDIAAGSKFLMDHRFVARSPRSKPINFVDV